MVFSEALHKSNVRITENINMVIKNRIKGYTCHDLEGDAMKDAMQVASSCNSFGLAANWM